MKTSQSFGVRLALLLLSIVSMIAVGVVVASVVEYKPYGVPDNRREEYDQLVRDLAERDRLVREAESQKLARVVVPETEFDFGFIDPSTTEAEHDFAIENNGTGNLVLKPGASSCKCTVAKLDNPIVKPGESTVVKLIWNAGSEIDDAFSQTAVIRTNDPLRPEIELTVSGKIAADWAFSSPIRVQDRKVVGQPCSGWTVLYSQFYDEMIVVETATSSESVSVSTEPLDENGLAVRRAKSGVKVTATYTPDDKRKRFNEVVRCKVLDPRSGREEWIETSFVGDYRPPVGFYGPEIDMFSGLDLGVVEIGTDKQWSFLVRFLTDEPVDHPIISKIEPKCLLATIQPIKRLDNTFRVTLSVDPAGSSARFYADRQGYVEVSDPDNPEISNWLPLHGHIIEN